ncbi:hypothetical protein BLNAU_1480 [Blattamonas nauphoetae]|uniref:Uncharacterized protein n=1 Tax=Blattamonas nauphoetae TaxID=2049346 RepID=A0ABQ9YI48_9EUKA|nr:hypothetical protein BLNAU_1480 [Blattamonas nauphoetae]
MMEKGVTVMEKENPLSGATSFKESEKSTPDLHTCDLMYIDLRNLQDDGHIVPQYALGWEICCHRSGVKGRFEQIAKQAEAKRQESEEMVARNMESDVEKKDSKTVVIPKEVKSPEPSQNKIEQEHTVALVVTLTDQTMAESIGEENKESTKQVEKKEEPKIQDNEILYENNGREEFIIDTRIQHFPPHDNAPTKSTSLNTASSTGNSSQSLSSRTPTKS